MARTTSTREATTAQNHGQQERARAAPTTSRGVTSQNEIGLPESTTVGFSSEAQAVLAISSPVQRRETSDFKGTRTDVLCIKGF